VGDQQTTRCFEIPACRTFMLAQRTPALCDLFRDGIEAAFFDSEQELTDKIRYYLMHETERKRVADAGYKRVQTIRCSWKDRLASLLDQMQMITNGASMGRPGSGCESPIRP
jgi:spore maturation protein CgeB